MSILNTNINTELLTRRAAIGSLCKGACFSEHLLHSFLWASTDARKVKECSVTTEISYISNSTNDHCYHYYTDTRTFKTFESDKFNHILDQNYENYHADDILSGCLCEELIDVLIKCEDELNISFIRDLNNTRSVRIVNMNFEINNTYLS